MLEIRFAKLLDTDNIMKFIHSHWKENHILSRDKDLFLYDYQDNDMINFVIAIDNKNNIYGILGFIKSSNSNSDIWAAMWKAIKHDAHPMLGIELLEYLRNANNYNRLTCVGINTNTVAIYHYLGIYTNHLNQYVIINKNIQKFNILKVEDIEFIKQINFIENTQYSLIKLEECELDFNFDSQDYIPHKDKDYFIKRYFNHPIYNYIVYGIYKEELLTSLIITREVAIDNSKILRVMDYLGDENDIVHVSKYIYQIVTNNSYEYIDFMCYGFDEKNLKKAGFKKVDLDSSNIIVPNYFSPFVQENIKIKFFADIKDISKIRICKADGDQDRPN
jgi:hypothetical protein